MEKVKGLGKKVAEAGKTGKIRLDEIRRKDWAEPTGAVLKVAANAASLIPPPAGGVIKGALSMGGSLLNPDPTLADLRRAKEEIQEAVKSSFKEVSQEMYEMEEDLSSVRDKIDNLMEMLTEKEFYQGIEDVDANHEYFMEGIENLQKTVEEFRTKAADFQTTFKRNFKVTKIFKYLKIVKEREGNLACEHFYHELLSAYGKFLQIIVVYLTFNGEHHRIEKIFSKFNKDYSELSALFNGIQEIPEEKEMILNCSWQIGPLTKADTTEEFNEAEVSQLKEWGNRMEINAEFGCLGEANTLFSLLFKKMKEKKFGPSQRLVKLEILNKIVSFHNIKYFYDEAYTWAVKALECLDTNNDPANLVIETLNASAEAFTAKSIFLKAKPLLGNSVVLSAETYGKDSRAYAKSLVAYADYLSAIDQHQKAIVMLEIGLKIVSKEEGERSVAGAKIIGLMARTNYRIHSTRALTVASKQAETALKVIEEKLGKNNFLTVKPKNAMAAVMKEKARTSSDKEEKSKLLAEAEKLGADCLEILLASLGDYNPFTASIMGNMGVTYMKRGRNSEAEYLLTKSLAIKQKILGENEAVALGHAHLAKLFFNMEDYGKAATHRENTSRIYMKVHGPAFSGHRINYLELIKIYSKTGE